jgi:two-component system, cell cycle sensor histidine kinase and response regulator CckA
MYTSDVYARVFQNARCGLLLLDGTTGRVTEVNAAFLRMAARARGEVVGHNFWEPPLIAHAEAGAEVSAHLRAGHTVEGAELPLQTGDGRWLLLEVSGSAPADGVVQLEVLDATGREQARLAARMDALRMMAGQVASEIHDLHQVLQTIGELLLAGASRGWPVSRELDEIQRASAQASGIAEQLQAFNGQLACEPQPVALNELIEATVPRLQRLFGRDVEIVRDLSPDLQPVRADPAQVRQILLQLAANAREAMPNGGIFRLETSNAAAVAPGLGAAEAGGGPYVMLAVGDNGQGFDEPSWTHLYEPFFSTKAKGKGRGLGLAAVHGIVRQSGGRLWVYSERGKGTLFRIYLPLAPADMLAVPETPVDRPRDAVTILLVEANDRLLMLMAHMLQRRGYQVLPARNAEEALRMAEAQLPDLLIAGPEPDLAQRLVRIQPRLRVLYLGEYADGPDAQPFPPGAAMLPKPFDPDTLLARVRELLGEQG